MPNEVYTFQMRGRNSGGEVPVSSKEEAQVLYDRIVSALRSGEEFVEVSMQGSIVTLRASDVTGCGVHMRLEPTQEELRAQAHAQIDAQIGGGSAIGAACGEYNRYDGPKMIGGGRGLL